MTLPDLPPNPVGRCITIRKDDYCPDCGRQLHEHQRKRVAEENNRFSYDYRCP